MKTTFTARHFEPTGDLHQYCEETVQKLDQFYERIIACDIILEPISDAASPCQAELNLKIPQKLLHVSEAADSYEKALNASVEIMSRQLKKYKNKHFNDTDKQVSW